MKKLIASLLVIAFIVSCKTNTKSNEENYVTFSGKITNKNSDSLVIRSREGFYKSIKVNEDGTFKDTFKVSTPNYMMFDGKEFSNLYLKNGNNIQLNVDASDFSQTLNFTGKGSETNTYIAKVIKLNSSFLKEKDSLYKLPKDEYEAKMTNFLNSITTELNSAKGLDSAFVANEKRSMIGFKSMMDQEYEQNHFLATKLPKGTVSPKFKNYENIKGGKMSLDDLKGKYVYIDLWATWCGPCIEQIPYLKKLEEQFHDKNIEFVSISIDQPQAYEKWKTMVKQEELSGIQLYAGNDQEFTSAYGVTGIPRFILIDPKGKIVTPNAPRPSQPQTLELFKSLGL